MEGGRLTGTLDVSPPGTLDALISVIFFDGVLMNGIFDGGCVRWPSLWGFLSLLFDRLGALSPLVPGCLAFSVFVRIDFGASDVKGGRLTDTFDVSPPEASDVLSDVVFFDGVSMDGRFDGDCARLSSLCNFLSLVTIPIS